MLPRLILRTGDPHRDAFCPGLLADIKRPEQYVAITDEEVAARVTHRRGPVAAAAD
ncbi:hypothetical protein I551_9095 [Mycobacterium ulcerans str. Harvey]|uniref:Uncharacterized protein n=1 Tax=Mycobacterium ulcerans str. Harvey TaxID=1299332 RepID=A0ABN0R961_MYCUL|nr:hypothetical protein I551_9095 [Mycobacterium ulcerans str. Harvey]